MLLLQGVFGFVFPDRSLEDAGGRFVEGKRAFSPTVLSSGATYCAYLSIYLPAAQARGASALVLGSDKWENAELLLATEWIGGSTAFFSEQKRCFYAPRCLLS